MLKPKIKNIHGGTLDAMGSAIIRGDYVPGEKLPPEQKLCEELGVSRTILREVVKSLVAKGLISTGPKIGTLVLPSERWNWFDDQVVGWQASIGFYPEILDNLQELRAVIEPEAVRLAAERATEEEIDALERAYHGMASAVERGSTEDYISHDYDFHLGLLRASITACFYKWGVRLGACCGRSYSSQPARQITASHARSPRTGASLKRSVHGTPKKPAPTRANRFKLPVPMSPRRC